MNKQARYALALMLAAMGLSQAQEPAVPKGWKAAELEAAIIGCTMAIVVPQQKAYMARAAEKGDADAQQEWSAIEPIMFNEFKGNCSCAISDMAKNVSHEQFIRRPEEALARFLPEIIKPDGKCAIDLERLKKAVLQARKEGKLSHSGQ